MRRRDLLKTGAALGALMLVGCKEKPSAVWSEPLIESVRVKGTCRVMHAWGREADVNAIHAIVEVELPSKYIELAVTHSQPVIDGVQQSSYFFPRFSEKLFYDEKTNSFCAVEIQDTEDANGEYQEIRQLFVSFTDGKIKRLSFHQHKTPKSGKGAAVPSILFDYERPSA